MRYELTDFEWIAIRPFPPNEPRGALRVNNRRVLNGIFSTRLGAVFQRAVGLTRPVTVGLFVGGGLASGT